MRNELSVQFFVIDRQSVICQSTEQNSEHVEIKRNVFRINATFCQVMSKAALGMRRSGVVPQIDPSVPQPVVQSRRRPLLGPSPG